MKNERHAIAGRNLLESSGGCGPIKLVRAADGLVEPVHQASLLIRWASRITDDVDEENMRDLEALVRFWFFRHNNQNLGCDCRLLNVSREEVG
jgi:hypothetical protein